MSEHKIMIDLNDPESVERRIDEIYKELKCLRRIKKALADLKKNEPAAD